jgi:hypothetical protein
MTIEEKLDEFIKEYRADQKENERKSNYDRNQNLMYIAWAFTVAMGTLAGTSGTNNSVYWVSLVATGFFFIVGWYYWFRSLKWSKK